MQLHAMISARCSSHSLPTFKYSQNHKASHPRRLTSSFTLLCSSLPRSVFTNLIASLHSSWFDALAVESLLRYCACKVECVTPSGLLRVAT